MDLRLVRRRDLLKLLGAATGSAALLAACGTAAATPAPTSAPIGQAPAAAPTTAPQAATAAAPTTAPQAAGAAATPTTAVAAAVQPAAVVGTATPQAGAQATKGAPVVPLFRSSANELPFLNQTIDLFKKNNPDVAVNPVFVPGKEYNQKTDLMVAGGDPPSLWFPASDRGFKYYSSKGLTYNLDPLIKQDNFNVADFYPRGLEGSKWKGQQHAIPISEWSWALFYNKTLFDKAKVPYPPKDWKDASWTWDKYLETAKALTVASGGRTTQFGTNVSGRDFFNGWTHGGWWFNKDWDKTGWVSKFNALDDPAVAEALQYWADAANKLHIAPTAAEQQQSQAGAPNLFMSGKVAMYLSDIGSLSQFAKIKEFEWGMAARPHPTKLAPHTGIWVDEWSMFKQVRNPEGSWLFMKHMVSPEGERIYPMAYGPIASRQSLGKEWADVWTKNVGKPLDELNVAVEAVDLEYVTPDNFTVNFSPINDEGIQAEIDKVFLGSETATDALKAMQPKVDKLIADTTKDAGA